MLSSLGLASLKKDATVANPRDFHRLVCSSGEGFIWPEIKRVFSSTAMTPSSEMTPEFRRLRLELMPLGHGDGTALWMSFVSVIQMSLGSVGDCGEASQAGVFLSLIFHIPVALHVYIISGGFGREMGNHAFLFRPLSLEKKTFLRKRAKKMSGDEEENYQRLLTKFYLEKGYCLDPQLGRVGFAKSVLTTGYQNTTRLISLEFTDALFSPTDKFLLESFGKITENLLINSLDKKSLQKQVRPFSTKESHRAYVKELGNSLERIKGSRENPNFSLQNMIYFVRDLLLLLKKSLPLRTLASSYEEVFLPRALSFFIIRRLRDKSGFRFKTYFSSSKNDLVLAVFLDDIKQDQARSCLKLAIKLISATGARVSFENIKGKGKFLVVSDLFDVGGTFKKKVETFFAFELWASSFYSKI